VTLDPDAVLALTPDAAYELVQTLDLAIIRIRDTVALFSDDAATLDDLAKAIRDSGVMISHVKTELAKAILIPSE
jgi:hypothetical protein